MGKTNKFAYRENKLNLDFDKNFDLHRVEPCSVLLLSEVLSSGVVPPDASELDYNDIDNPDNVAGRVQNVFDAIDLSKELASSGQNSPAVKPGSSAPASAPSQPESVKPGVSTPNVGEN